MIQIDFCIFNDIISLIITISAIFLLMAKFSDYLKDLRRSGQLSFTIDKVVSDLKILERNALVAIHRIKKRGEIISPARGFYVLIPPEYQLQGCIPAQNLVPILMKK